MCLRGHLLGRKYLCIWVHFLWNPLDTHTGSYQGCLCTGRCCHCIRQFPTYIHQCLYHQKKRLVSKEYYQYMKLTPLKQWVMQLCSYQCTFCRPHQIRPGTHIRSSQLCLCILLEDCMLSDLANTRQRLWQNHTRAIVQEASIGQYNYYTIPLHVNPSPSYPGRQ